MTGDITLGQFFPGKSLLHRADPRMKLILSVMMIVILFLADNLWSLLILTVAVFLLVAMGRIPVSIVLKSLKPVWFIILFTSAINIFWGRTGELLFSWKFIHLYEGSLLTALFVSVRIILLIVSTGMLLSFTTSPIALTDGLEQLLYPLSLLKIPVHSFTMMITIAMRFIPILMEETEKIISAQKARGADFESGSLIKKAKAMIPVFIPLFVSSIRHADNLATAMECRCYTGGNGRTHMNRLHYSFGDFAGLFLMIALGVGVILSNLYLEAPGI